MAEPVRIALWGTGAVYRKHISVLLSMQAIGLVELVAAVDSAPQNVATLDGMPVIKPDMLETLEFDHLLIMSTRFAQEMIDEATQRLGIPRSIICSYSQLSLPSFDLRSHMRLLDSRVSIVSNTGWGGLLFSALQMEPVSPFVGTMLKEQDYLRMLSSLEEYLAIDDLLFRGRRYDSSGSTYLSFGWGDLELRFTEEEDPHVAVQRWLERRAQFNWDNVLVQMSTVNPEAEQRFEAMGRYPNRVCFVPYASGCAHSIHIPVPSHHRIFNSVVNEMVYGRAQADREFMSLLLWTGDRRGLLETGGI